MATKIETVDIDDVYPLVDEYGNNLATRDYSLKENQKYVEELARSMKSKGVPDEMVTLVRDGGIYRIKAGNSRVEAMRKLGTRKFPAIVEDESTEQAVIETVVRTNTKKKYTALEESQFVRQLALFGDDAYVSEVSGLDVEKVAKVRKAATVVKDAADDMSLLRLITIGEFADDPEAVEALKNCQEKEYEGIAKDLRKERQKAQRKQEMQAALGEMGVKIVDDLPDGVVHKISVNSVSGIPDGLPEGSCAIYSDWNANYSIYAPEANKEIDPEVEKIKAQIAEINNLYEVTKSHREEWLVAHIADNLTSVCELEGQCESPYWMGINAFLKDRGIELDDAPARSINSYLGNDDNIITWQKEDDVLPMDPKCCLSFISLTDAMKDHGYEPCDEEQVLFQLAHDYLTEEEK